MIQRIQTVYLLLAAIALVVGCIFEPMGYNKGLTGSMALLTLLVVFMYKNRTFQANICSVLMGIGIVYYVALAVMQPLLEWFAAMPMVAVLFLFLARKGILKDEKLVKSLDRIRYQKYFIEGRRAQENGESPLLLSSTVWISRPQNSHFQPPGFPCVLTTQSPSMHS